MRNFAIAATFAVAVTAIKIKEDGSDDQLWKDDANWTGTAGPGAPGDVPAEYSDEWWIAYWDAQGVDTTGMYDDHYDSYTQDLSWLDEDYSGTEDQISNHWSMMWEEYWRNEWEADQAKYADYYDGGWYSDWYDSYGTDYVDDWYGDYGDYGTDYGYDWYGDCGCDYGCDYGWDDYGMMDNLNTTAFEQAYWNITMDYPELDTLNLTKMEGVLMNLTAGVDDPKAEQMVGNFTEWMESLGADVEDDKWESVDTLREFAGNVTEAFGWGEEELDW